MAHTASRFRNHFGSLYGMAVVLADGEIARTGMGALPGTKSWGEFNMGLWLMPKPQVMFQAAIAAPRFYECTFLMLLNFPIVDDPAKNAKRIEAFRQLITIAAEHGGSEYRAPPIFHDQVMAAYSYNNHSQLRLHERIKDAPDPKVILSPSRYGIWPQGLRPPPPPR